MNRQLKRQVWTGLEIEVFEGQSGWFWCTMGDLQTKETLEDIAMHGPFETEKEAFDDAEVTVFGNIEVKDGGTWPPVN